MPRRNNPPVELARLSFTGLVVTIALTVGLAAFTVAALLIGPTAADRAGSIVTIMRAAVVALAVLALIATTVAGGVQAKMSLAKAGTQPESQMPATLAQARITSGIIGMAGGEGTGMLGAVTYLLWGDWIGLAVGWAAFVLAFFIHAPLPGRVGDWVDQRMDEARRGR